MVPTPWMSRLFGPLSLTISRVSWRDWALAGDQTAGAGNRLPAATAVIDLRNSRRFMAASGPVRVRSEGESARAVPARRRAPAGWQGLARLEKNQAAGGSAKPPRRPPGAGCSGGIHG